jgi:hypothetical protein
MPEQFKVLPDAVGRALLAAFACSRPNGFTEKQAEEFWAYVAGIVLERGMLDLMAKGEFIPAGMERGRLSFTKATDEQKAVILRARSA